MPWRERDISRLESSQRCPCTVLPQRGGHCDGAGDRGTAHLGKGLLRWQEGKGNKVADTEQGLTGGRIWRSFLNWQRTL